MAAGERYLFLDYSLGVRSSTLPCFSHLTLAYLGWHPLEFPWCGLIMGDGAQKNGNFFLYFRLNKPQTWDHSFLITSLWPIPQETLVCSLAGSDLFKVHYQGNKFPMKVFYPPRYTWVFPSISLRSLLRYILSHPIWNEKWKQYKFSETNLR